MHTLPKREIKRLPRKKKKALHKLLDKYADQIRRETSEAFENLCIYGFHIYKPK